MQKKKISQEPVYFWTAVFIYVLVGIYIMPFYKYQLNPDGVTFISVARKYLAGDFKNAVNGCWGPLFSWLLIPLLALKVYPTLAVKVLYFIVGFFAFPALRALSYRFKMNETARFALYFTAIPIFLAFAFLTITQDFLFVFWFMVYLSIVFDEKYGSMKWHGSLCGLLGALSYLSKPYAFMFFTLHFFIVNLVCFLKNSGEARKLVVKTYVTAMIVFVFISSLWIYAIYNKYGEVAISTVTRLEWRSLGPAVRQENLMWTRGLFEPPNKTAISVWEDFTGLCDLMPDWSPFSSVYNFKYFISLIVKNTSDIIITYNRFTPLAFFIVLPCTFFAFFPFSRVLERRELLPVITFFIYPAGYFFCHIESRYLWPITMLLLLMGASLISKLTDRLKLSAAVKTAIIILFFITFIFTPVRNLIGRVNADRDIYFLSNQLSSIGLKGRIASDSNWVPSLYVCFHLNLQYIGQLRPGAGIRENEEALKKFNVDYLIQWRPDEKGNPMIFIKNLEK